MVAALLQALPVLGAEQVTVERATALRAEPRGDASMVAELKPGAVGEVLAKDGAWLNIKTPAATGWVFMFHVRFGTQAQASTGGGGSMLGRLFAPSRQGVATSTIGIRGLDETDLRQAHFNADQMRLLDEYAASRDAAQAQARDAGLSPARIEYLGGRPQ
jgi:hypothetical protein